MTDSSPENSPDQPKSRYEVGSSADPIVDELRSLAQDKPNVFQMLVQHFWNGPGGQDQGNGTMQIPREIVEQSLANDRDRFRRTQNLRVLIAWIVFLSIVAFLVFVLALAWLLRDHVEFTEKILACIALAISHGAIGAGAYYSGKSRGGRRRK